MAWTLTRTATPNVSTTLPDTFNLSEYNRETKFVENTIDGADGSVIDSESIRTSAQRLVLVGIIKGTDASNADTQLTAIENVATADGTLTLLNTVTTTTYSVQHVHTRARRLGAGVLHVTLTFASNFTRI